MDINPESEKPRQGEVAETNTPKDDLETQTSIPTSQGVGTQTVSVGAEDPEKLARRKRKAEIAKVVIAMVLVGVLGFVAPYVYDRYRDADKSEVATETSSPLTDTMPAQDVTPPLLSVSPPPPAPPAPLAPLAGGSPPIAEAPSLPPPPAPAPKPVIAKVLYPQIYTNGEFGVEISMPNIVATQTESSTVAFYNGATIELYGFIEKYIFSSSDLGMLYKQLRSSPNVTDLYEAQVSGHKVLLYSTNEGSNAAVLINGTVYYVHGQLAAVHNLPKLKFL